MNRIRMDEALGAFMKKLVDDGHELDDKQAQAAYAIAASIQLLTVEVKRLNERMQSTVKKGEAA